ncbi:hypothetical protein SSP35_14_00350 [Streptomyces sp. NBRC 110611]|uniref:hypothetical protein n=1 Tax=Streptomyces sp. NBRC 110611 TaxID=1621259 RepID=UPI000836570B|nr:hypothetical protein [Streptomyces sp. NBRC 110611]GAU69701.1 hypothetical protein SSP35_14_00350 [Streptomyces sp. NBRC 110611]
MSDEHRRADGTAPRAVPNAEERRLARQALAGRARDASELKLLMDMLDLDPSRDPDHEAAYGPGAGHRPPADPGRRAGRGTGRDRRHDLRRDTCRDARSRSGRPSP